jgi:hypothetical protein
MRGNHASTRVPSAGLANDCRRTTDRARRPSYDITAGGPQSSCLREGITEPNSVRTGKWRCSKPTILLISIQEQSLQWVSGTPSYLLADHFGKPQALFDKFPKERRNLRATSRPAFSSASGRVARRIDPRRARGRDAGVVKAGGRTLGVVRLALTEKGRSMIVR